MKQRAFTLVSTVITIALIAILATALFYGSGTFGGPKQNNRKDGLGKTIPGAATARAKDEVCKSNLQQLRQMIQVAQSTDDQSPASLSEIRGASSIAICPIDKKPYEYDPQTGQVHCTHPGHENY